jgi:hypothetical protein
MTTTDLDFSPEGPSDPEEVPVLAIDDPVDMRPDLGELGILEHERGVCEDTYENRNILRKAKLRYQAVYDPSGRATGLISAFTNDAAIERRIISLAEKRPLLVDPDDRNSDFFTGLDLVLNEKASAMVPPWVLGSTRAWLAEQEAGGVPASSRRAPKALPHRCRIIKSDTIRCMLWSSGRIKDDGLCRIHLKVQRKPGEDIERARAKLVQAAPYAVDVLEELMETAESEPVRLKASTEILDRAGVRGGTDLSVDVTVDDKRDPHDIVLERLNRLRDGANAVAERLARDEAEIVEAEVVQERPDRAAITSSIGLHELPDGDGE